MSDDARRRHYADFYDGVDEDAGPLGVVLGNCQAESLRLAIDGAGARFVRVPAVHELVADDLPHLERLLGRVEVLVAQPIRDDYHGLPLGSRQVLARTAAARTAIVPVIRFAGLYPWQAIVRPPADPSLVPPVVPYHDLRVLAEAAGSPLPPTASAERIRAVGAASLDELRRRERHHDAVVISDALERPAFAAMRTLNHPGNPVWEALAERVHAHLGLPGATQQLPRQVLDAIHAPRERSVIEAWGLDDEPVEHWIVGGGVVEVERVRAAHLDWYREHPEVVSAGLARHAATLQELAR
ncbi:hypothetical protein GCM10009846_30980 [Agrococcus versicolor]|uniref:Polysaccharide biosynthesis enzyme WcbI domain-containing protein n=1 Tax=Agrococcus versicolor TaxID=501482 RepID=A0ABP5MPM7_9MICO